MRYGFIIVFNGAKTLYACATNALKSVDRLIIVEGVVECISYLSGPKGRSTDGTEEIIYQLIAENGDRVIPIFSQAPFWRHKLDMCNAALQHVEMGSWLIEFDSDELYFPDRLNEMMEFLEQSNYTCAEVWARHYYGSLSTHTVVSPYQWGNILPWRRMFRYTGYQWWSHAPPRLGCFEEKLFPRELSKKMFSIEMHHAAYVWRSQVELRAEFFKSARILNTWDMLRQTGIGPALVRYDGPKPWKEEMREALELL